MNEKFYVTAPIYYPNADLHMGHAYTTLFCDVLARHARLQGKEAYFLVGTDEHASKVVKAAIAAGMEPQEFVNKQAEKFKTFFTEMEFTNSDFVQTSNQERHWPGAQLIWEKLVANGDIYKKKYSGLYCIGCESFKTEKDLVDGLCPDHNTKPELVEEENYFFRLSKYGNKLKEIIESGAMKIFPETRKNEILSLIADGLEDVSFSRPTKDSRWGIPVPGDPGQTMYVWCDALTNYITYLGYGRDDGLFKKFWPADLHIVGKDILRFHTAIWPAMLISAGLPVPKAVLAHGMITSGGKKMSKTIGNIIDPKEVIKEYGVEALRYLLTREVAPFEDGDLTLERIKEVYNANLANGLGNLTSRIMKMSESYLETPVDLPNYEFPAGYQEDFANYELNKAMDFIWQKIGEADLLITEKKPFSVWKTDQESARVIVIDLIKRLGEIAFLLQPFMPTTADKIVSAIKANKLSEALFLRKE